MKLPTKANPFFSFVVPTYNRADLIGATLASLLRQEYPAFEIIVVDDGSQDDTEGVVSGIPDERIRYVRITNGERGRARNVGVLRAKGEYVTFIDSDDLAYPNHLAEANKVLHRYQHPEMFHLAYEMKDGAGNTLGRFNNRSGDIRQSLLKGNIFSCIGVFLRRDIARQFLFEEDRNLAGTEDWLLWLRLAARFPIYYSNVVTSCMIQHESRSVMHFNKAQLLHRTKLLLHYLQQDEEVKKVFGQKALQRIKAHMYTYIALHSVLSRDNSSALQFLFRGLGYDIRELFQRRTLAIGKHLVFNLLPRG